MSASDEAGRWEALERLGAELNARFHRMWDHYVEAREERHPIKWALLELMATAEREWLYGIEPDHLLSACMAFRDAEWIARKLRLRDVASLAGEIRARMEEVIRLYGESCGEGGA